MSAYYQASSKFYHHFKRCPPLDTPGFKAVPDSSNQNIMLSPLNAQGSEYFFTLYRMTISVTFKVVVVFLKLPGVLFVVQ